ncbi:MAG: hypothetical protein ONB17_07595 [candidate division KSB1 bacterium]|nr:hypothetical protein [candidate division KSB1 bacterium]MDZ7377822.1 hypothetical protein [candidate division KSB1 bacterium]MDZ7385480.1 hypothetical protein [candidate division KSB1 bacterium]MDZ7393801.1 hypothetical protein [candidate division KSB1 bacterium]
MRRQRRTLLRAVGIILFGTFALLLYVWQHVHAQHLLDQIAAQEKRVAVLEKEVAQLETTRETLLSYNRVTDQAAQHFQLGFYRKRNLVVPPGLRPLLEQDKRESVVQ